MQLSHQPTARRIVLPTIGVESESKFLLSKSQLPVTLAMAASMAGMRKVLAVVIFVLAAYCLLLTIAGVFRSYAAHIHGTFRGHSFHGYTGATVAFMVATGILGWAGFKLWPKRIE